MEAVLVAVVGAAATIAVALIQRDNRKHQKTVLQKIQTNHGREPWEYLEEIAEVHAKVDSLVGRIDSQGRRHEAYMRLNERAHEDLWLKLREMAV